MAWGSEGAQNSPSSFQVSAEQSACTAPHRDASGGMGWKWENPAPFACCAHHAGALTGAGRFTVFQLLSCSWPFLELHICLQEPESRACILRGGIALPKSSALALSGAHLRCCCTAPPRPAPDLLSFRISDIRTEMQQYCHIAELGTRRNTAETDDQGNNLHN